MNEMQEWVSSPHVNTGDSNMDSSDTALTTRQHHLAAQSSSAKTDASSSTSVLPRAAAAPLEQSRCLQAPFTKTSELTSGTSGLVSSGRKRKLSEKDKSRKVEIKKRHMMEVDAPVINVHRAQETDIVRNRRLLGYNVHTGPETEIMRYGRYLGYNVHTGPETEIMRYGKLLGYNVHTGPETEIMRYGRLLGYNVVTDSNNYITAQSAFGYGDISQSNDAKRQSTSSAHSQNLVGSGDISASTNFGTSLGFNVVPERSEYLVVQSAYGYGDISQSGSSKRVSQCSSNGLGCTSNKRLC